MHNPDRPITPDRDISQEPAWRAGGMPHPAAIILLWLFLAIALQSLNVLALLCAGFMLTAVALRLSASRLYTLLRRTRWIMISLLLIYGYVTPGESLWAQAGSLSPTQEGLFDGLLQLGRLVFALAGLSIVLSLLTQQQLMGGIYALAHPLRHLGISSERIAVRLALTLHYAEFAMLDTADGWRNSIARMIEPPQAAHHEIELHAAPLTPRDGLLIAAGSILLALVLLGEFGVLL
jgi:energy-coupling factor transporter transmembrane protein EcfT